MTSWFYLDFEADWTPGPLPPAPTAVPTDTREADRGFFPTAYEAVYGAKGAVGPTGPVGPPGAGDGVLLATSWVTYRRSLGIDAYTGQRADGGYPDTSAPWMLLGAAEAGSSFASGVGVLAGFLRYGPNVLLTGYLRVAHPAGAGVTLATFPPHFRPRDGETIHLPALIWPEGFYDELGALVPPTAVDVVIDGAGHLSYTTGSVSDPPPDSIPGVRILNLDGLFFATDDAHD